MFAVDNLWDRSKINRSYFTVVFITLYVHVLPSSKKKQNKKVDNMLSYITNITCYLHQDFITKGMCVAVSSPCFWITIKYMMDDVSKDHVKQTFWKKSSKRVQVWHIFVCWSANMIQANWNSDSNRFCWHGYQLGSTTFDGI